MPHSVSAVLATAATPVFAGPQYGGQFGTDGTWNVYEWATPGVTWDQARVNASQMSFNGTPGHLVSIHSAAENTFIGRITGGDWWIGLTDSNGTSTPRSPTACRSTAAAPTPSEPSTSAPAPTTSS